LHNIKFSQSQKLNLLILTVWLLFSLPSVLAPFPLLLFLVHLWPLTNSKLKIINRSFHYASASLRQRGLQLDGPTFTSSQNIANLVRLNSSRE